MSSKKKPSDKKTPDPDKPILGRPSNHVTIGVVGMPNVGKSTLFNLLSKVQIPAENYPFCTIDPNLCIVEMPDPRYDFLVEQFRPASAVHAQLSVTDIAGLVRGASEGEGLGNAFLSHIRAVDAIYHVLRAFDDDDVIHVENTVDPVRDLEIISGELRAKDIEFVANKLESVTRTAARGNDRAKKEEHEMLTKIDAHLREGKDIRFGNWSAREIEYLNQMQLLTAKQVVFLVNLSERDFIRQKNRWLKRITDWVKANCPGDIVIPYSAAYEKTLMQQGDAAPPAAATEAKASEGSESKEGEPKPPPSMLSRIIRTGYNALHLIHYFTCGADEVKCWTIRRGTKAPQAAGVIHTDFERGFICAEVMSYDDYVRYGSEQEARANGRYRMEGKNYTVQDGDIIFFKFNPTGGGANKKK